MGKIVMYVSSEINVNLCKKLKDNGIDVFVVSGIKEAKEELRSRKFNYLLIDSFVGIKPEVITSRQRPNGHQFADEQQIKGHKVILFFDNCANGWCTGFLSIHKTRIEELSEYVVDMIVGSTLRNK